MFNKIGVLFILLFSVILFTAPIFAEEAAVDTATTEPASPSSAQEEIAVPAAVANEETAPAQESSGEGVITGDITNLDSAAITIKAENVEKTFSVVNGETILWKGVEDIKLTDIKKGDKAEVGYYTDESGKLVASWVDLVIPEEPSVPGAPTTETETSSTPATGTEE